MSFRDRINKIILHDTAGHPANEINRVMPYHTTVFPDATAHYRNPADPYGEEAPHAYRQNPEAIGIAYSGASGGRPTPEGMRALQLEIERANKRSGRLTPLPTYGHGEIDDMARRNPFDIRRASRDGRPITEASWRDRANELHQVPEAGLQPLSLLKDDPLSLPASAPIAVARASPFAAPDTTPQKRPSATPAPEAPSPKPAQEPVIAAKPPEPAKPTPESPFTKPPAAATAKDSGFDQFHAGATQSAQRMAQEWMQRRRPKTTLPSLFGGANA